ncbi:MAG: hypothetical protein ABIY55_12840 [Kofleriaceae bacterium]
MSHRTPAASRPVAIWLALVVLAAFGVDAAAANRKILVLPVDGTADAATRAKLTAQIVRLARALDGQVTTGDTTFADTALAVGCDPDLAGCRDDVIATLAVDELVWGTATKDGRQTRLVVRRAAKGAAPREIATTIAVSDAPDRIEAGVAALFAPPPPAPSPSPIVAPPVERPPATAPAHHHDRNIGIVLTVTGGVALGVGAVLWASYGSLQDQIDAHPTRSRADFDDLTALEDRAATRALAGDLLVGAGLVAAGVGAYYLLRRHDDDRVAIAPAPIAHGAALTLTIVGGL